MSSPAWLPLDASPSASQTPGSVPSAGGPSTPTADSLMLTSKSSDDTESDSMKESLQMKNENGLNHAVPVPSFSYNMPPNSNVAFGTSQQPSSSSVSAPISIISFFFFSSVLLHYCKFCRA